MTRDLCTEYLFIIFSSHTILTMHFLPFPFPVHILGRYHNEYTVVQAETSSSSREHVWNTRQSFPSIKTNMRVLRFFDHTAAED